MNLLKIIDDLQLDKIDQEEYLKPAMRRGLFKKASEFSLKAALTSLPFAMLAIPKIVKASTQDAVTDTLNFALTLEYLEAEFYQKGLAASGLITDNTHKSIFSQISKHETAHVALLKSFLGSSAVSKPNFDFTGSKNGSTTALFPDVWTNIDTFLALSQAFEDTGVRAYKGQAGNLMSSSDDISGALTVALQIHSVEARHAAEVRRLRGAKGYITQKNLDGLPSVAAGIYGMGSDTNSPGEDNQMQGGADLSGFTSFGVTSDQITQAFDEPLDKATVTTIASLFIY